jgi:hypothetical protein
MDMTLAFPGTSFDHGRQTRSDFGALVALLSAAQAALPTAYVATKLAQGSNEKADIADSLIEIFAPSASHDAIAGFGASNKLQGSFNPAVSKSHTPVTERKPW